MATVNDGMVSPKHKVRGPWAHEATRESVKQKQNIEMF
jgi:hypothetical protein